ncbi:MAG TPA: hypothetical protein VHG71_00840 [Verrucomicrobiae bacterium]|nr:hypothetical protein [Verrucomicrobiae bacterium]
MKNKCLQTWIAKTFAAISTTTLVCALSHGAAQAQPTITSLYPDGANQFQASSTLAFVAGSTVNITNVSVTLTPTSLSGQQGFPATLTPGNGLTVSGPATSETVSALLVSNTIYTASIHIADANGALANTNISFDTITPAYTFEAEDFDYGGGLFISDPQTNGYAGLTSVSGVDYVNTVLQGNQDYRPWGLETESLTDKPRLSRGGLQDYDVGWNNGGSGNWGNYTRVFPAGLYNIYIRVSNGNGQVADSASISVVSGNATLNGATAASGPSFTFSVPSTGWPNYVWVPLVDASNNLVQFNSDGLTNTLRVTTDNGNYNANFYMLIPADTNPPPASTVVITNVFPNGAYQFQQTNVFSFTAASPIGIGNIQVLVTATNLAGQGFTTNLSAGSGLTITGNPTNENVSFPLATDLVYSVLVYVADASNNPVTTTVNFDTLNPNYYTIEAEDWDYNNGGYFDNPQTNAYYELDGNSGVDYNNPGQNHSAYLRNGLNTEGPNGDTPRLAYVNTTNQFGVPYIDYDVGFTAGGQWANYTRNYPAGVYNIYVRAARGDGGNVNDAGSVSLLTSGYGTSSQTLSQIGKFNVPSTGNWQKYVFCPVLDNGGNLARFVASGSLKTLRFTMDGAGHNQNFFLFVPADLSQNPPPFVSNFEPDSSQLFQFTNQLSFVVNSSVGISTNDIVLNLDGTTVSGLTFSGSSTLWTVTYPVKTNSFHTAIITVTDTAGSTTYTNSFGTYNASNYQWEAEDYDYNSGNYFDNLINAYTGVTSVSGVDFFEADSNPNEPFDYRPAPAIPTSTGDVGGELPRSQFTSGGGTGIDYDIGYFGNGSWANYTRHYPTGTYNVVGRFAEGNNPTEATLSLLTSGYGTPVQTTNVIGTFFIPVKGWTSWEWAPLKDANGNNAVITLDGSLTTLQLEGTPVVGQDEVNVNFLMLVPTVPVASPVTLAATRSSGNIVISFPTQNGFSYQVLYKASLTDPTWTSLGSPVSGNGSVQSVNDTIGVGSRFYRVQISQQN